MAGNWRNQVVEKQPQGFITLNANETGAMVVKSKKGKNTPMFIQSEKDVLTYLDKPSALYPNIFELIAFTREAPCWVVSAYGVDALYGGIDVLADSVEGFGVGRDFETYDYSTIERASTYSAGNGDGVLTTFTGTLPNVPITNPITSFTVKVNGVTKDIVSDGTGTLTGADVTAGTLNLTTGEYSIQFSGTAGEYATVTSTVDLSTPIDLSTDTTDKLCSITIDGVTKDVNFGQSASTSQTDVVNSINAEFTGVASVSTDYIKIDGVRGSTLGNITIDVPSTGDSALTLLFNATALTDVGVNPIGAVPGYNEAIVLSYNYSIINTLVSHSFYTTSPYEDDLSAYVISQGGSKFTLYLFQKNDAGNYATINSYNYSLIREKDSNLNSLYYEDVFKNNPFVQVKVNANYSGTTYAISSTTQVLFSGGDRGSEPQASDYLTAWNKFQAVNKYRAIIFMDVSGNSATTIATLCTTYQTWAQGITVVPYGNTTAEAIAYRSGLGIDNDKASLYHNWARIQDDYNNSFAWISNAGSVGKKFALCAPAYDAQSPAGVDANGYGGQLQDWRVLEVENDYTEIEGGDLQQLDEAQINPIKFDDLYGLMADGDRTLQVTNNDTSFIGARRLYNLIIDVIKRQVMRQQQFKNNDSARQLKARTLINSLLRPIFAARLIREYEVVCDSSNNTDEVLGRREFVIDVYIKVTPNSQKVRLNFIRLSQTQTVASVIPAA